MSYFIPITPFWSFGALGLRIAIPKNLDFFRLCPISGHNRTEKMTELGSG